MTTETLTAIILHIDKISADIDLLFVDAEVLTRSESDDILQAQDALTSVRSSINSRIVRNKSLTEAFNLKTK